MLLKLSRKLVVYFGLKDFLVIEMSLDRIYQQVIPSDKRKACRKRSCLTLLGYPRQGSGTQLYLYFANGWVDIGKRGGWYIIRWTQHPRISFMGAISPASNSLVTGDMCKSRRLPSWLGLFSSHWRLDCR